MSPNPFVPPDPELAAVLRRLRIDADLSQEEVARRAGLSTSGYAKIERGVTAPAWGTVRKIADALELTMARLGEEIDEASV